jgi:hypothetical protein
MPLGTILKHDGEGDQHTTHEAAGEESMYEGNHE